MKNRQMLVNGLLCADGVLLWSRSLHDYQAHTDGEGNFYFIDGGTYYVRSSVKGKPITLYYGDDHELLRESFSWGGRGVNGDEPLHYIKLKDITEAHLEALIIYTDKWVIPEVNSLFIYERAFRETLANTP